MGRPQPVHIRVAPLQPAGAGAGVSSLSSPPQPLTQSASASMTDEHPNIALLKRFDPANLAGADDVFGESGLLAALTEGGALVYNGVTIGTVTTNSGGVSKMM